MRRVRRQEKGQCRRRGQFYLTVQSAAGSELLTARERDRPEENVMLILTRLDGANQNRSQKSEDEGRELQITCLQWRPIVQSVPSADGSGPIRLAKSGAVPASCAIDFALK
jgi:hypothetical protein